MSLTTTGAKIYEYINTGIYNTLYTFTSAGQIVVSSPTTVSILVVGGGGGGGGGLPAGEFSYNIPGGGGGAGGVIYQQNISIQAGTYNVTIGAGGNGMDLAIPYYGTQGGNTSVGSLYIAVGGGVGGFSGGITRNYIPTEYRNMVNGGSGGGGGSYMIGTPTGPGTGLNGQGYNGGLGSSYTAGGGGGGGSIGGNASGYDYSGPGGIGFLCNIIGAPTYYAGGGGGGTAKNSIQGAGGLGGGGNGICGLALGSNATFYGGGGGGGGTYPYQSTPFPGYNGYQGVVILATSTPSPIVNNILGNIPDWLQYKSNRYTPFYVKGFFDISGNVIVRNGHLNMIDSDIQVINGNLTLNTTNSNTGSIIGSNSIISAINITCVNNNILINQNAYFNARAYITGNLTTGTILTSANIDLSFNSNITVYGNVTTNQNNLIVGNMTVGILKPNSSDITTSCGAGYNIVNNALIGNTISTLNNNVIIGGNIAPLAQDVKNSTLIGSNILCYNNSIISNVTAVGAFAATNNGIKTNSTYIGAFAGTDASNNSVTSYNQTNNTFIGGNTYAGNDADSQTSIGFGCVKSVAIANIMYVGTTSTTMVCPNKLNIGPVPGSLGALNVDGNGFFLGNMYPNDISMNLNDASFSNTASINTAITNVNNCGFMITANYKGSLFAGANFGIMGGVQDASSVMVLPNCKVFLANIFNTGVITGTNLNICIGKNGSFAGNSTNQITCPSNNGAGSNVLSVAFTQGDELSIVLSPTATVSSSASNSVLLVQIWCRYF